MIEEKFERIREKNEMAAPYWTYVVGIFYLFPLFFLNEEFIKIIFLSAFFAYEILLFLIDYLVGYDVYWRKIK